MIAKNMIHIDMDKEKRVLKMTKQEAIEYGKTQLDIFGGKHAEFIELAIEVLENEFCEASHILYNNIDNIEWKHLPKPITEYYDKVMRYCYLGNELYFFKYTDINVTWSDYFMAKGNSPWDALRNHFRWSDERYKNLRSEIKPLTR